MTQDHHMEYLPSHSLAVGGPKPGKNHGAFIF
jgi:hypothetical protein